MNRKKQTLSIVIVARNEAPRIGGCIGALGDLGEIIVIDNGSSDETAIVAKQAGARVITVRHEGFATLRNHAMKYVSGAWVLSVDADEMVTPTLARAIEAVLSGKKETPIAGYELYRKNYYLGHPWPGGEWMLRLFRVSAFRGWEGELHETARIEGEVARLEGELLHDTHRTLAEMVDKTNEWSETEAELRFVARHPAMTWWRMIRVTLTGFFHSFFTLGGWRAGTVGWIESIYQGFSLFITYAKLWELQQKKSHE